MADQGNTVMEVRLLWNKDYLKALSPLLSTIHQQNLIRSRPGAHKSFLYLVLTGFDLSPLIFPQYGYHPWVVQIALIGYYHSAQQGGIHSASFALAFPGLQVEEDSVTAVKFVDKPESHVVPTSCLAISEGKVPSTTVSFSTLRAIVTQFAEILHHAMLGDMAQTCCRFLLPPISIMRTESSLVTMIISTLHAMSSSPVYKNIKIHHVKLTTNTLLNIKKLRINLDGAVPREDKYSRGSFLPSCSLCCFKRTLYGPPVSEGWLDSNCSEANGFSAELYPLDLPRGLPVSRGFCICYLEGQTSPATSPFQNQELESLQNSEKTHHSCLEQLPANVQRMVNISRASNKHKAAPVQLRVIYKRHYADEGLEFDPHALEVGSRALSLPAVEGRMPLPPDDGRALRLLDVLPPSVLGDREEPHAFDAEDDLPPQLRVPLIKIIIEHITPSNTNIHNL
ncbi:uncharacterized protein G2W53_034183 [Senna tora]|uniref:Uncharacterized protein n=1 Tax=Senna tora TaxID=362788 RepID=A0A834T1G6_9FABA|nr:uncharacterized protein G2W53_034183 [Senna tora]